jgi:hypothetical protein
LPAYEKDAPHPRPKRTRTLELAAQRAPHYNAVGAGTGAAEPKEIPWPNTLPRSSSCP